MQKKIELGQVIARRVFQLKGQNGQVTVEIGVPRPFWDGEAYICPFRISGPGWTGRVEYTPGEDSVQALELVMGSIGARLYNCDQYRNGLLYWLEEDDEPEDLGFPRL